MKIENGKYFFYWIHPSCGLMKTITENPEHIEKFAKAEIAYRLKDEDDKVVPVVLNTRTEITDEKTGKTSFIGDDQEYIPLSRSLVDAIYDKEFVPLDKPINELLAEPNEIEE